MKEVEANLAANRLPRIVGLDEMKVSASTTGSGDAPMTPVTCGLRGARVKARKSSRE